MLLGVLGAALDVLSGFEPLTGSMAMSTAVGTRFLTGAGLVALGFVVLATGVLICLPRLAHRMALLGGFMEVCGILMGLASSYVPSMNDAVANLMLVIAILMFLNGALMQSRRKNQKM